MTTFLILLPWIVLVFIAIVFIGARMNTDLDEAEQEEIERMGLPIPLRKQAD